MTLSELAAQLVNNCQPLVKKQALIVFGLQNDLVGPNPKVPVPLDSGWFDRIKILIPKFRYFTGDIIIFVRSEIAPETLKDLEIDKVVLESSDTDPGLDKDIPRETTAETNDDQDVSSGKGKKKKKKKRRNKATHSITQFFRDMTGKDTTNDPKTPPETEAADDIEDRYRQISGEGGNFPCLIPGSEGAAFTDDIAALIQEQDLVVIKKDFSAFKGTNLVHELKMRIITDLYLAGCMTNLSVYATAQEAASHGLQLNILEDCLGYRSSQQHDLAIKILKRDYDAATTTSTAMLERFEESLHDTNGTRTPTTTHNGHATDELAAALSNLGLDAKDESMMDARKKHGEATAQHINIRNPMNTQRPEPDRNHDTKHQLIAPTVIYQPEHSSTKSDQRSDQEAGKQHTASMTQKHSSIPLARTTMNDPLKSVKKFKTLANLPTLGPDDVLGEGDSFIRYELLGKGLRGEIDQDTRLSETVFGNLYHEVQWQKMFHAAGEVPRLVAVQGSIWEDGSKPVYRHPSDQSPPLLPFTKHVNIVRHAAEQVVGHELNHVLIQLYRSGQDYISEHSDKTLDIKKESKIVNVSFGAQRTMRLRTKRSAQPALAEATGSQMDASGSTSTIERVTQRIHMPHDSIFVLGLKTNCYWLHGINQDKRAAHDRHPDELAYDGMRISLTFRLIDTFLSADEQYIWGQGAKSKSKTSAGKCINANETEAQKMIDAFGVENRESIAFDWDQVYGKGFDVLNLKEATTNIETVLETTSVNDYASSERQTKERANGM